MMKYLALVMLFFCLNCYGQSPEVVALEYVSKFSKLEFGDAAKMVYCSNELDEKKTHDGHAGLAKELEFLTKEFGTVSDYKISSTNLYVAVSLGCAPFEYLKTHPAVKTVVVEVSYKGKNTGYITVAFIEKEKQMLPILVNHGIPMNGPLSVARITSVYKKLSEL
jgi:hypothetical protein